MIIRIQTAALRQELISPQILLSGIGMGITYLFTSSLLLNMALITETMSGLYTVSQKSAILLGLTQGILTLYSPLELSLMLLLGFLMGVNLSLILKSLQEKRKQTGDWSIGVGFLGLIATTGCASCGITLFSLAGPTISLGLLPFQGILLQGISAVLLLFSLIHTLNRRSKACIILKGK